KSLLRRPTRCRGRREGPSKLERPDVGTGDGGDVLFAVDFVCRDRPAGGSGLKPPEPSSRLRVVRFKIPVAGRLEHQSAGGHRRTAGTARTKLLLPGDLVGPAVNRCQDAVAEAAQAGHARVPARAEEVRIIRAAKPAQ